jgi:hypothetical protein
MRKSLAVAVLIAVAALIGLSNSQRTDAAQHIMRVYGVMAGANGDTDIQYVELRMATSGQNVTAGYHLCFYEEDGDPYARFTFPSNVSNFANGASILVATSEFNADWPNSGTDFNPDFVFEAGVNTIPLDALETNDADHPVQAPGGKVGFGFDSAVDPEDMCLASFTRFDSIAYGTNFDDADVDFGNKFATDLPTTGTDAVRLTGTVCYPPSGGCTLNNHQNHAIIDINTAGNYPRKNNGSLSPVGEDPQFSVLKDFVPNAGSSVTVSLVCMSGTASPASASASEAAPAVFTVSGNSANVNCTATESPIPDGYVSSGTCVAALLTVGQCTVVNTARVATFDVQKDFDPDNAQDVTVDLNCTSGTVTDVDTTASESDAANFTVTAFNVGATCTATETVPGGYAEDESDCASRTITDGMLTTCEIVNTEAADTDGDTVPDSADNCPSWPNMAQNLPPWTVPDEDDDCDGFPNANEVTLGTDPDDACGFVSGDPTTSDSWPPDLQESDLIDILDVLAYKPFFNGPSTRHDLQPNGVVDILDVLALKPYFNKNCT